MLSVICLLIYDVIKKSKYAGRNPEKSFNNNDVKPKNKAHKNVRYWNTFENEIVYKGEAYNAITDVRALSDDNYIYSVRFFEDKQKKKRSAG